MSESVNAVERALDILLCFNSENPKLSLSQIAVELNLPKSTTYRHLATLEKKHFINREVTTGMYRLGLQFVGMASLILQEAGFQHWTQPHLERLSDEYGETVDLAVLDGTHVIYLQVIECTQRVKIAAAVGQRLPAYCTASGKAFLAFLPEEQIRKILPEKLNRYTENTIVSFPGLYADLNLTRQRGFSISRHEYEEDINAVAAPILNPSGYPVAVIAVAGPSYRLLPEKLDRLGVSIKEATHAIAQEGGSAFFSAIFSKTEGPGTARKSHKKGNL